MTSTDGLDDLLMQLKVGRWNFIFFVTSGLALGLLPIFLIGGELVNPQVAFTCELPDNNTRHYNRSECLMVQGENENEVILPCKSWTYDTTVFHSTISMEWNLVCGREPLSIMVQTLFTIGAVPGSICGAIAANRKGRRWIVRVGSVMTVLFGVLVVVSPWLWLLMTSRFFLGVFHTAVIYPAFLLAMEVCAPSFRGMVGLMLAMPYAAMMIMMGGLAYLIRDWRLWEGVASSPGLLLLPFAALLDESPRWLVVRGRLEETVKVLERGARLNGSTLPDTAILTDILTRIHEKQVERKGRHNITQTPVKDEKKKNTSVVLGDNTTNVERIRNNGTSSPHGTYNVEGRVSGIGELGELGIEDGIGAWWAGPVALVYTPVVRRMMGVLLLVWMMQGVVYMGLPLSSSSFSSPFLFLGLMGIVEIPAYSITPLITQRFGRRLVASFSLLGSGLLLAIVLICKIAVPNNEWAALSLMLAGYLLTCTAYQVNFLFTPELLPTTLRPWGTAACDISAYIGFSLTPIITTYVGDSLPWLSSAMFSASGFIAGALVLFLPETAGRPLPETVADLIDGTETEMLIKKSNDKKSLVAKGSQHKNIEKEAYANKGYNF